ncbi:UDP-N-acetylmuramate dehydrogenase [Bacillus sp. FJAT-44742]|uniref:UDP-N-acetylmuramate dehydrogenase n=1 Tax=Bacillus sp. FJAT-44742 TaxID=2014005 RepID=UPI000C23A62F|nr:UDP-N-acetylmuramate dehydrogenase [Bacillus sp. FJAT-44742]
MFNSLQCQVKENVSLATYTSWKVGGKCRYFIEPNNKEDIQETLSICKNNNTPYFVIGKGSNILINDEGFNGAVIYIGKGCSEYSILGNSVSVQAGMPLPKLAFTMAKLGFEGFEFYAGIPGTVGGAVVMNAGSAGEETKNILKSVTYLNDYGILKKKELKDLELGFRSSSFLHSKFVIIEAEYDLREDLNNKAIEKTKKNAERRRTKFPLNIPSAGSTFKSPPQGPYPGKLIEEAGLKGYRVGGARISERHGNWIENVDQATAKDIKKLIRVAKNEVKIKHSIVMEEEVICV